MGFFSKRKYKAMSIKELYSQIRGTRTWRFSDDMIEMCEIYVDKLLNSSVSDGGLGERGCSIFSSFKTYILRSVYDIDAYLEKNEENFNYILEFVKNFAASGINYDFKNNYAVWSIIIDQINPLSYEKCPCEYVTDKNSFLYDPLLYKGDSDCIVYKIKSCIFVNDGMNVLNYGLYKKDKDGNLTTEQITYKDFIHLTTKKDLQNFFSEFETDDDDNDLNNDDFQFETDDDSDEF